jgi:hypothetical protein
MTDSYQHEFRELVMARFGRGPARCFMVLRTSIDAVSIATLQNPEALKALVGFR